MRSLILMALIFMVLTLQASAQSIEQGEAICYEAQRATNALADFTQTHCLPAGGSAGALSFIVISSESVFSGEASKKAWLLVAVAALGKALNERPQVKADKLFFSDAKSMKSRTAYVLPAPLAKSLQQRVYNGDITVEDMYTSIQKSLIQKKIPKK